MVDNENLSADPNWERKTLEKLVFAAVKEQRRGRRWGTFFKLLFFSYLFIMLWILWPEETASLHQPVKNKEHVALIDIRGEIGEGTAANAEDIIAGLQEAFKDKNTEAVVLRINSPGGSPVQAGLVYDEIHYLRNRYKKTKIYTVCTDLCASAAYYVAAATDAIYANPSSLVGSIGVLMDGFGFVDSMQKLGMQRRLITSGAHKGFLDPFSPIKPDEEKYAQGLLNDVYEQFINRVKAGRGDRLKETPDIFSGLVWTGNKALPLGLIDGYGSIYSVAREVIKNKNIVDYTVKPGILQQLADRIGASFSHAIASEIGLTQTRLR